MAALPVLRLGCILLLAFGALTASTAAAQVRRCDGPDGKAIYTDRRCNEIGAAEALPRAGAPGVAVRQKAPGCARNVQDLIQQVTSAIEGRDVNRLAALYHWVGMSSTAGYQTLARLDAIANRPLVDVVPVLPHSDAPAGEGGDHYSQTTVHLAPIGLRLEQTLGNGSTPSRTYLGLRRHLDCLWIQF